MTEVTNFGQAFLNKIHPLHQMKGTLFFFNDCGACILQQNAAAQQDLLPKLPAHPVASDSTENFEMHFLPGNCQFILEGENGPSKTPSGPLTRLSKTPISIPGARDPFV